MRLGRLPIALSAWLALGSVPIAIAADESLHRRQAQIGKYFDEKLRREALRVLIQTYLATFESIGIETWLMHGSLLGWWWNKRVMPWDDDADVMVSEPSMFLLAAYYNMTTYYYEYPAIPEGRSFLLDINPHYLVRDKGKGLNSIDARWIDMEHGLFIDITTARYNVTYGEGEGVLVGKDGHLFRDTYLLPLLETTFEGVKAKIPYKYKDFLISEYGKESLSDKEINNHHFDEDKMEWVPTGEL
ncbi:hypothetical protein D7B24_005725 [Verticillium nonalfalfae]|uniref:LicD/FKTN/FKRP nucleotidyltransferase domain-containing protein n=1 Tax=Verticillium nonalfalfae TaxID=1051616 RepID=A0A3M9YAV8_9PEZI|nr:uncharacterized protein D7B24_005725 [Verticillium nonalfalfae]RNJ57643.1 hypothetical protein D7B24_005725 [Verticillium nonalfalfae]